MRIKSRTANHLNTYDTYASRRGTETIISDVIERLTPNETPFTFMIGTQKLEGTHPEWHIEDLGAPNASNKRVQGDVYSFSAITPTTKIGTYTQIMMKEFIVAETEEVVSKTGPKSDYNREMAKKGLELKIDREIIFLSNQASLPGNSTTPAQTAGLRAWTSANDVMGTGGVSGGFNSGTSVVDAATNGTQRAFTLALLREAIAAGYTAGGNPDVLMLSPYLKGVFSSFLSDASVAALRTQAKAGSQAQLMGAADGFVSDFGTIDVLPNRQLYRAGAAYARNAFLIDKNRLDVGTLRPIQQDKEVAKTSDALPGVLKTETALINRNPAAQAVISDLFGMSATA